MDLILEMASLNEAFGEEGRLWNLNHMQHLENISSEGMKKSFKDTFGIDFAHLVVHPKLRFTDDGCSHYISHKKLSHDTNTIVPDKHYIFDRRIATWYSKDY